MGSPFFFLYGSFWHWKHYLIFSELRMQHTKGRLLSLKSIFCGKQCLWKSDKNLWPTKQNSSIHFISTTNLLQLTTAWVILESRELLVHVFLLAKGESCTGRISAFGLDSMCNQSRPRTDILFVWSRVSSVNEIGDLLYNWECLEKMPQSQTGKTPQLSSALAILVESKLSV